MSVLDEDDEFLIDTLIKRNYTAQRIADRLHKKLPVIQSYIDNKKKVTPLDSQKKVIPMDSKKKVTSFEKDFKSNYQSPPTKPISREIEKRNENVVCNIIQSGGNNTGFLVSISGRTGILTNCEVFQNKFHCEKARAIFENSNGETTEVRFLPEEFFLTNKKLNATFVACEAYKLDKIQIQPLKSARSFKTCEKGASVYINFYTDVNEKANVKFNVKDLRDHLLTYTTIVEACGLDGAPVYVGENLTGMHCGKLADGSIGATSIHSIKNWLTIGKQLEVTAELAVVGSGGFCFDDTKHWSEWKILTRPNGDGWMRRWHAKKIGVYVGDGINTVDDDQVHKDDEIIAVNGNHIHNNNSVVMENLLRDGPPAGVYTGETECTITLKREFEISEVIMAYWTDGHQYRATIDSVTPNGCNVIWYEFDPTVYDLTWDQIKKRPAAAIYGQVLGIRPNAKVIVDVDGEKYRGITVGHPIKDWHRIKFDSQNKIQMCHKDKVTEENPLIIGNINYQNGATLSTQTVTTTVSSPISQNSSRLPISQNSSIITNNLDEHSHPVLKWLKCLNLDKKYGKGFLNKKYDNLEKIVSMDCNEVDKMLMEIGVKQGSTVKIKGSLLDDDDEELIKSMQKNNASVDTISKKLNGKLPIVIQSYIDSEKKLTKKKTIIGITNTPMPEAFVLRSNHVDLTDRFTVNGKCSIRSAFAKCRETRNLDLPHVFYLKSTRQKVYFKMEVQYE